MSSTDRNTDSSIFSEIRMSILQCSHDIIQLGVSHTQTESPGLVLEMCVFTPILFDFVGIFLDI